MSFVHLHAHSHYTFLEGLPKPADYVSKAKELGMNAVALTDTANIHGCHEFYKACKSEGINPILGTEFYLYSDHQEDIYHKIVLLATSLEGYRNILRLISSAALNNPGTTPALKLEELDGRVEDIICLSGPIQNELAYLILAGKTDEEIYDRISKYQDIFGKDNFYIELLYHDDIPKQKLVTDRLVELCMKYDLEPAAANDVFYIEKTDAKNQDIIQALGSGHEVENPDRPTKINGDYSFLTEDEMVAMFGFYPKAIENTQKIAERVDIHIETGGILIPTFELPEEPQKLYNGYKQQVTKNDAYLTMDTDEWYLRYLAFKGMNWRYDAGLSDQQIDLLISKLNRPSLDKKLTDTLPQELKDLSLTYYSDEKQKFIEESSQDFIEKITRLEYELVVINEMGFNAYFLIVADYIGWARDNDIPVGPGRGSAAGSLMAFLTGITDIDPLPYKLLFERFLNPARVSMPDIDTDFADDERDKVVEYCRQKYGSDHVGQICTFGTFAARAAVKDVGRVMGVPFSEMNQLGKLIPEKPGTKLKGALEEAIEFKETYNKNRVHKKIIDSALQIEGNVRQLGVHACAVIIAPEPMTQFTALTHPPKDPNAIVTQYSAYPLEDLGLLKMDFLGLRNLTIIKRTLKIIKNNKGDEVDMSTISLADPKVFEVFAKGDTTGVFQFESDGMRKYLKDLAPNTFEDLIAMVSLYRPGPLAYIPNFIDRKYGREEIQYMTDDLINKLNKKYTKDDIAEEKRKLIEDLGPILDVSYGIAVYQEQLMFIVQDMAGFSLGEADLLRRGVGKKKIEVIEKLKKEFITRAQEYKGYKPETSQYIYEEMIQPAANYSFNKSHAACYALIAYQTAYLKAYYQGEFLTAMMVSDEENMDRIMLEVGEAVSKGINILPPDINESLKHFTYIDDNNIRFGLKAIKGLGDGPIDALIATRKEKKFENIDDFMQRVPPEVVNKKSIEALVYSGAMDMLGKRSSLVYHINDMLSFKRNLQKQQDSSQMGLFGMIEDDENTSFVLSDQQDMDFEEKIYKEQEILGYMVSGHPLDGLEKLSVNLTKNKKNLQKGFVELSQLTTEEQKEFNKKLKKLETKAMGVIKYMRKIITKTGKNMVFLSCEGYDYDFEVTVFDREYQAVKHKLAEGKIVIVSGELSLNFEYKRKNITARKLQVTSLSHMRNYAKEMGFFNNKKRLLSVTTSNEEQEEDTNELNTASIANKKDSKNNILNDTTKNKKIENINECIISVPHKLNKDKLFLFKNYLLSQGEGKVPVFLELKGQKVYTKKSVEDPSNLLNRIKNNW